MEKEKNKQLATPDPEGKSGEQLDAVLKWAKDELGVKMKRAQGIRFTIRKQFQALPEKYKVIPQKTKSA